MNRFVLVLLWFSALAFGAIGVYFLSDPERGATAIGVALTDAVGRTDFRATYGGGMLGVGLVFAWLAWSPGHLLAGAWSMALIYGGFAFGRGLAIALGERPGAMMWSFLVLELAVTAAAVWAIPQLDGGG